MLNFYMKNKNILKSFKNNNIINEVYSVDNLCERGINELRKKLKNFQLIQLD